MKKAMLLVPHQDDELLVGGGALVSLVRSEDWAVKVVYLTNGDSRDWEARIRMEDSMKLLISMGMKKSDVIYMGYGNRWSGERHLYNCEENVVVTSRAQKRETYGVDGIEDYHFSKYHQHAQYTRQSCKSDLKEIISEWFPSLIISVDLDKHEDHIALSLLFEECMGEILKENREYLPLILKKYAYSGVWNGEKDYWDLPHKETLPGGNALNHFYEWEERLQFDVPEDCNTTIIKHNLLYRLARTYRTQYVWTRVSSVANDDICFWRRPSENLALSARILASSGDAACLNDFMLLNSNDIRDNHICQFNTGYWTPDEQDDEKTIMLQFDLPQDIDTLVLYENSQQGSGIGKVAIFLNDMGERLETDISARKKNVIPIRAQGIRSVKLQIMEYYGREFGISELELYGQTIPIEAYELPMKVYERKEALPYNTSLLFKVKWDKKFYLLRERISREWWLPRYELRNQYGILEKWMCLYGFIQIYRLLRKVAAKLCTLLFPPKEKQK